MTWLTTLSRSWIINILTALAVLAAGILKGGDDMADSAVKRLDYRWTYCISCTGSRPALPRSWILDRPLSAKTKVKRESHMNNWP